MARGDAWAGAAGPRADAFQQLYARKAHDSSADVLNTTTHLSCQSLTFSCTNARRGARYTILPRCGPNCSCPACMKNEGGGGGVIKMEDRPSSVVASHPLLRA
eukprot:632529-Pelagomonas_calceolata.AAC.4